MIELILVLRCAPGQMPDGTPCVIWEVVWKNDPQTVLGVFPSYEAAKATINNFIKGELGAL